MFLLTSPSLGSNPHGAKDPPTKLPCHDYFYAEHLLHSLDLALKRPSLPALLTAQSKVRLTPLTNVALPQIYLKSSLVSSMVEEQ
jgi:hypothetical protein